MERRLEDFGNAHGRTFRKLPRKNSSGKEVRGGGVALATRIGNLSFTTVGYAALLPPLPDDNVVS
jgi:hypothetical protein